MLPSFLNYRMGVVSPCCKSTEGRMKCKQPLRFPIRSEKACERNKHQHGMIDWVCTIKQEWSKINHQRYSAHIISCDHMCEQNAGRVFKRTYMHTYVSYVQNTPYKPIHSTCFPYVASAFLWECQLAYPSDCTPNSLSWLRSCRKLKGSKRSAATLGFFRRLLEALTPLTSLHSS